MSDLFENDLIQNKGYEPLSSILRPTSLADVFGQDHLLRDNGIINLCIKNKKLPSLIFWGNAGIGKTTISLLLSKEFNFEFRSLSAVSSGVSDLKKVFDEAQFLKKQGKQVLLFCDEIHRFNKAQQDQLLPYVENGVIILCGATTENPSFELNSALLSRCRVCVLNPLNQDDLLKVIEKCEKYYNKKIPLTQNAKITLVNMVDGDCRYLLNQAEVVFEFAKKELDVNEMLELISSRASLSDKSGDVHYNLISALHKSLRGSDENASLYWGFRMVESGQDCGYIFRRILRFASEDIGNADPQAVPLVLSCWQSFDRIGKPEGLIFLSQALIYLALAPKSNASYVAMNTVATFVKKTGSLMPPKNILNAPTTLMKDLEYGKNYKYDHDLENGFSGDNYFPEKLTRQEFYKPVERGFERELKKRIDYFNNLRKK